LPVKAGTSTLPGRPVSPAHVTDDSLDRIDDLRYGLDAEWDSGLRPADCATGSPALPERDGEQPGAEEVLDAASDYWLFSEVMSAVFERGAAAMSPIQRGLAVVWRSVSSVR
jgi:hypothetical protein